MSLQLRCSGFSIAAFTLDRKGDKTCEIPANHHDGGMTGTLDAVDLPAGLYLVATPIGNLRDITLRALDVLARVDVILCEDTRMTAKLLQAHGITGRTLEIYNDHTADKIRPKVLSELAAGRRMALVSDAGTPLISDPGYKLVRDALDLGLMVTSLPGANAVLTALQLSGLPTNQFSFLGFLPPKAKARRDAIAPWAHQLGTLVLFESGPRLIETLIDLKDGLGDREAAVVRELTKMFEESRRDLLSHLIAHYESAGAPKGEIVIVVAPAKAQEWGEDEIDAAIRRALKTMSVKDAAAFVAAQSGAQKKKIYDRALALKS
jgi:16S rRNA (cytidine1402-2'-O)-methyltransferase